MFQTSFSKDDSYLNICNCYGYQYWRSGYTYGDNYLTNMFEYPHNLLGWKCNLGTPAYIDKINRIEAIYGSGIALEQLIDDFNTYDRYEIEDLKYNLFTDFYRFCKKINELVRKVVMTKKIHYFRNKINKAPKTLEELLKEKENWILVPPHKSAYHMHGIDGILNLKFVSKKGGHFESIYDKDNNLVTNKENMGTYNFVGSDDHDGHRTYDVEPYYRWGNTEECVGDGEVGSLKKALNNLINYSLDLKAIQRYQKYYFEMNSKEPSINDSIKLLRNKILIAEGIK
ncbi:hypothetical protein Curi_c11070 [Gottschalkia acidurici 9a]|uniref:Uncharacterized protein n=1 Tax=Gottschalkia acidurici (strain ATCC 7906 / DSM 604 / BCRC 14475 / CIP 104303 / KCTC 5404 / NCIMB 10678 / 9a) TaxID=1128398 RepID=K0B0E8_GOTA9|nr:hypothetical protein [Gottschalkia acidurici]AFS78121.1 hypothetical protein Curi_c11070 [Gottschalkia acidurici 9a]